MTALLNLVRSSPAVSNERKFQILPPCERECGLERFTHGSQLALGSSCRRFYRIYRHHCNGRVPGTLRVRIVLTRRFARSRHQQSEFWVCRGGPIQTTHRCNHQPVIGADQNFIRNFVGSFFRGRRPLPASVVGSGPECHDHGRIQPASGRETFRRFVHYQQCSLWRIYSHLALRDGGTTRSHAGEPEFTVVRHGSCRTKYGENRHAEE